MPATWLLDRMRHWADEPAIAWRDDVDTYRDLIERIGEWGARLDREGVEPGQVVALEGDYSPSACALLLALIQRRSIVVPLTESVHHNKAEFLDIAQAQTEISIDEHDESHVGRRPGTPSHELTRSLVEHGRPGLVLFTSGSTGKSKAALHDFSSLLEKFKVERRRLRTVTFLLLDHIGGINTLLYALSNGGMVVALESRQPETVCETIERHRVELLPTSPTFLNLLLMSQAYKRFDLSSLKTVTYGTEPMPKSTLSRLRAALPDASLLQTYGLTETGILRAKSKSSDSLWVKLGGEGVETKVVDGVLWIRSQTAMLGYLNHPSPFDQDGWFNTHDLVEVDGDHFRILGRRSEMIKVGGQKVYPAEVESVLLEMEGVSDATVFSEPNPITGQVVAARVNLSTPMTSSELKREIRRFCKDRLEPFKIPVKVILTTESQFSSRFKKQR